MKFKEYIATHQVFTTQNAQSVSASPASAETSLRRALAAGEIERVRRGVYVSKTGKFYNETPDPFLVLTAADPNAVISYHAALVAHGVAHNVSFACAFRSSRVRRAFEYGGIRYIPYPASSSLKTQTMHAKAYGTALVTTREQTLVDCLSHPGRAGGIEEVVRSCSTFPYLDLEALEELLVLAPAAVVARVGWLLEAKRESWGVEDDLLRRLKDRSGKGPAKLDPRAKANNGWLREWKLYLPESEEEVLSWLS